MQVQPRHSMLQLYAASYISRRDVSGENTGGIPPQALCLIRGDNYLNAGMTPVESQSTTLIIKLKHYNIIINITVHICIHIYMYAHTHAYL